MNQLDAERLLRHLYPEATLVQVTAVLTAHVSRGEVHADDVMAAQQDLQRELQALEWVRNNPVQTLAALQRTNQFPFDELDVALSALATTYDQWADGILPSPDGTYTPDVARRRTGARHKANQLRTMVKAVELRPEERSE